MTGVRGVPRQANSRLANADELRCIGDAERRISGQHVRRGMCQRSDVAVAVDIAAHTDLHARCIA